MVRSTVLLASLLAAFPAVSAAAADKEAPVEVVLFTDFQCPFCAQFSRAFRQLERDGIDGVKTTVTLKHFPLSGLHEKAQLAHQAAVAAGRQGKFWEMHDLLFANQRKAAREDLVEYARTLGLDIARFERDMDAGEVKDLIAKDVAEGNTREVSGTPTFFVNGKAFVGARSFEQLRDIVQREYWRVRTTGEITDAMTSKGPANAPVDIELFADLQSPVTRPALSVLEQLTSLYPSQIRIQFRHFPLAFHPEAAVVHEGAVAAARGGHFWDFAAYVLDHQSSLREQDLIALAARLGFDPEAFAGAVRQRRYAGQVEADVERGRAQGLKGSPVILVDGHRIDGVPELDVLIRYVDSALGSHATLANKD